MNDSERVTQAKFVKVLLSRLKTCECGLLTQAKFSGDNPPQSRDLCNVA